MLDQSRLVLDYLAEYRLDEQPKNRRKKVSLQRTVLSQDLVRPLAPQFSWRLAQKFENRASVDDNQSTWPLNGYRVSRRFGTPALDMFPDGEKLCNVSENTWVCAKRNRPLHYFRVTSSEEALRFIQLGLSVFIMSPGIWTME